MMKLKTKLFESEYETQKAIKQSATEKRIRSSISDNFFIKKLLTVKSIINKKGTK